MQPNQQVTLQELRQQFPPNSSPEEMSQMLNQVPIDTIPELEIPIYIPIEDYMIQNFQPLERWAKQAHQILREHNVQRILELSRMGKGEYSRFLKRIEERYQKSEYELQAKWLLDNQQEPQETQTSWRNQARLAVEELLMEQLGKELL